MNPRPGKRGRSSMALALLGSALIAAPLAGCLREGQSRYNYDEVGRSARVEFGTVVNIRNVEITGENTLIGGAVGGAGGAIAGAGMGRGTGTAGAVLGLGVAGAALGYAAEQALSNRTGIEYTVVLEKGKVITIVQEKLPEDRVFAKGERVMVQASGTFQRVLPTDNIPTEMARPKGIKLTDD